jgi:hypothetical protein
MYVDNRWVTAYDDIYGPNHYNATENAGTGVTPITEYEHLGLYLPAGTILKSLTILMRNNSSVDVTDANLFVDLKTPEESRWLGGYDNDTEDSHITLLDDLWYNPTDVSQPAFTGGAITDLNRREYIFDHTVAADSMVALYMQPVGDAIQTTRYFYATHIWTLELPIT